MNLDLEFLMNENESYKKKIKELRLQNGQLLFLADFSSTIFKTSDLDTISHLIINQLKKLIKSKKVKFMRKESKEDLYAKYVLEGQEIKKVNLKREELKQDSFFIYCNKVYIFSEDEETMVAIPIKYQGENLGAIIFEDFNPKNLDNLNHKLLDFYGDLCGLIIKNAILVEKSKDEKNIILNQNIKMENELKLAQRIQKNILPSGYDEYEDYTFYKDNKEAYYLGGDFYDIFLGNEDEVVFYIADVSGHGVGASLLTVFLKQTIRGISKSFKSKKIRPDKVLKEMQNRFLDIELEEDLYIGILVCVLNLKENKITFSNAGHNVYPIHVKGNYYDAYKIPGLPINHWFKSEDFYNYQILEKDFEKGDKIFLLTDGSIEAKSKEGIQIGNEKIEEILFDSKDNDLKHIFGDLCKQLKIYTDDDFFEDDIAFVAVERK
ncbi:SpoIIE family protein phosphatase [Peptostreptococcaceae bacterium AGR-M142]